MKRMPKKHRPVFLKHEAARLYLNLLDDAEQVGIRPEELTTIMAEWVYRRTASTETVIQTLERKAK